MAAHALSTGTPACTRCGRVRLLRNSNPEASLEGSGIAVKDNIQNSLIRSLYRRLFVNGSHTAMRARTRAHEREKTGESWGQRTQKALRRSPRRRRGFGIAHRRARRSAER